MMVATKNLRFSYSARTSFYFPDIVCPAAGILLVTGASGTGKTTLLHLLAGMLRPSDGQILIDGTAITSLNGKKLDAFRGRKIGIVFQQPHFVQSLTVGENLDLAAHLCGKKTEATLKKRLLTQLKVSAQTHKKPHTLSLGEQQRVSIARALIHSPAVILADEPTSSLDDENCREVAHLLVDQSKQLQASLIIVTHDQRLKNIVQQTTRLS